MTVVPENFVLAHTQHRDPVLWITDTKYVTEGTQIDTSDEVLDHYLGPGTKRGIKSFGHDPVTGVHFLLTRKGTEVHTDKAYLRYSHQLVLRNDGNRVRGMPKFDHADPSRWRPMMVPGMLYCLDTHSPHQGLPDPRFDEVAGNRRMKAVLSVDRATPLDPPEALALLETYLDRQMAEFAFDPDAKFLKWKEPGRVPPKAAGAPSEKAGGIR